jgi:hypothetical protein
VAAYSQLQFYTARAEQAREDAEAATLDHVRERCRRSEAAWSALAERAERSEQMKAAEALRRTGEPHEK